jgi:hypothetical protein
MAASARGEDGIAAPGTSVSIAGGAGTPAVEAGYGFVVREPAAPAAISGSGPDAPGIAANRLLAI